MEHKIRSMVCMAGQKIVETGLSAGTWGNVSARTGGNMMLITPSAMDYSDMNPEDIVLVDINTLESRGSLPPSSETPMHAAVYRERPEINGIIHTHPQNGCTVASAHLEVPPILDDMVQLIGPSLRTAPHAYPGTPEMVEGVLAAIEDRNACLLANHGAVCIGRTLEEAFTVTLILEKTCRSYIDSFSIGGAVPFTPEEAESLHKMYMDTYSVRDQKEKMSRSGYERQYK